MNAMITLMRALVAVCAVSVCVWARCPWFATAGLAVLGAFALGADFSPLRLRERFRSGLAIGCVLSLLVPAIPLLVSDNSFTLADYQRYYQAVQAWLVAVSVLPLTIRTANPGPLRLAATTCAFIAVTLWLASSWAHNLRAVFYLGLVVALALLILCKLWFRLPGPVILTVNTLILLILVLGIADFFVPPPPRLDAHLTTARRYYSYELARKDPLAFERWWNYFLSQWLLMSRAVMVPAPGRIPTYHLQPGTQGRLFDCPISINSLGFRGREIAPEKGSAYRIVALGESTTFGCTLGPEDKPWPELLEEMIQERLNPRFPVQVINAGVPGYTLADNLARLAADVLPLRPDMIISYHGYNGFPLLDESLPVVYGQAPPVYQPRPLRLLAKCEYRLKMLAYRRRHTARPGPSPQPSSDLMATKYAGAYGELVRIAHTNSARLVLATFSMAANAQSDPEVINFYRAGFPWVKWQIDANDLHSRLVREIARQNPTVSLVDTQPGLDGAHERFADLVHLTQEGRRQLAETVFAGIKPVLEADFSRLNAAGPAP